MNNIADSVERLADRIVAVGLLSDKEARNQKQEAKSEGVVAGLAPASEAQSSRLKTQSIEI